MGTTHHDAPPPGPPRWVVPTWWPRQPQPRYYKSHFQRKKSGRKNYCVSRDGAAATSCSSLGGQIWSPFGAPEMGIFDLRHHQPISIANSMMLLTGSEYFLCRLAGEELDEIYHVIKLVLLGFDPYYSSCSKIDVAMTLLCLMLVTRARVP